MSDPAPRDVADAGATVARASLSEAGDDATAAWTAATGRADAAAVSSTATGGRGDVAADHARRRAAVAGDLARLGVDELLVTHGPNVGYLSGFTGSAGAVLLDGDGAARLVTDGRYATQAGEEAPDLPVTVTRGDGWLEKALADGARLGLESHVVSWDRARALADRLAGREVVPAGAVVEGHRAIKDDAELAWLRAAAAATDAGFADLVAWLGEAVAGGGLAAGEVTERRVAAVLEGAFVAHGGDAVAFPTIVAAGEHGARPHHRPTDRPLRHGDLVTVDAGARVAGYHADMTRLLAVGGLQAVGERLSGVVEAVAAAQRAGVAAVADGVAASEVDAACRQALAGAGLADAFVHGTGHGVGQEVHEAPRVAATSAATLATGMVCTVEPGAYLPGVGGARIEDVVAVTADGGQRLTTTPRDVVVI